METLVRGLEAAEPVPIGATEAARAVFTWRTIDAEMMEIDFDSAVDELTGVRSAGTTVRAIRFAAGAIEVDLDVDDGRVDGQVIGAVSASVRLERPDDTADGSGSSPRPGRMSRSGS